MTLRCWTLVFALGFGATVIGQTPSVDWPQWRGADRNGLSRETGLLQKWPTSGPPLAWSVSSLGAGYGSLAIKGDRIFVQGAKNKESVIYVLNRADGRGLWSKALGG